MGPLLDVLRRLFGGPRRFKGEAGAYGISEADYRDWQGEPPPPAPREGPRVTVLAAMAEKPRVGDLLGGPDRDIVLLQHPGELAEGADAAVAQVFEDPAVMLAYGDEDRIDSEGRRTDPIFRTAFDAVRLHEQDYIGDGVAVRAEALRALPADTAVADLPAVIAARFGRGAIRHIPRVLRHRRSDPPVAARDAVAPALPGPPPKALVIVPTRDGADLLRGCATGVLERTDYPALELCIVDNGSTEPEAVALLADLAKDPRVRVLRIDAPFNFSALNNAAVEGTDAEVLVFLNNDTVVMEPGWLTEMAALAIRPETGAVGAKLFYADGRIQHAGVTLGLGLQKVAGHPFRGAPGDLAGPQDMLLVRREVSAVTAACLAVAWDKFLAVGGFDPALAVAYNDVDLCLKLGERWRNVWTPFARMTHLETASRGHDVSLGKARRLAREAKLMRDRWGERLLSDPYYHPALSLKGERWNLAPVQRDAKPR